VSRFTKWIPGGIGGGGNQVQDKDPIPFLIQLYSCDSKAIENLAQCRINPDLKSPVRKDLEFFIPQLCSFYLQGYDQADELVELMVQASRHDFYFSHRVWFFFRSVLPKFGDKEDLQRVATDKMLRALWEMIIEKVEG
jgi:hypothetical protein